MKKEVLHVTGLFNLSMFNVWYLRYLVSHCPTDFALFYCMDDLSQWVQQKRRSWKVPFDSYTTTKLTENTSNVNFWIFI